MSYSQRYWQGSNSIPCYEQETQNYKMPSYTVRTLHHSYKSNPYDILHTYHIYTEHVRYPTLEQIFPSHT
jgi:hypothetical protein